MFKRNLWPLVWVLAVLLTVVMAGTAAARAIEGAVQQEPTAPVCTWREVGQIAQLGRYHVAGASDTVSRTAHFYGGLDQAGEPSSVFTALDLSAATLDGALGPTNVSGVSGALKRYGSVGLYRTGTVVSDTALVAFVGGSASSEGGGTNAVQTYNPSERRWTANASATGSFAARLFHAGAYDSTHDVAVFHGGTAKCGATDDSCSGGSFGTALMRFDPAGGMTWEGVSVQDAPGRIFGHSMVYDSVGDRMLLFGGTTDGSQGRRDVYAMSTADLGSLSWVLLGTAGTAPTGRAFHAAAFWPERNWMVVLGGVTSNLNASNESIDTKTWALDLGQTPPQWIDLGASPGRFMGAALVHDANHGALVAHGGRGPFVADGTQQVSRRTYALTCEQEPGATATATGTSVTMTPAPTSTETIPPPFTVTPTVTAGTPVTPTVTSPPPTFVPTATETPVTPAPTAPPTVVPTPTSPPPTSIPPTTVPPAAACRIILGKVPASAIADAIANPANYYGYGMTCNPNVPPSPWNPVRSSLTLKNRNVPYHPLFNPLVWSCSC